MTKSYTLDFIFKVQKGNNLHVTFNLARGFFLLLALSFAGIASAQTGTIYTTVGQSKLVCTEGNKSCPANDLTVKNLFISGASDCINCETGDQVTRDLYMVIDNTTGSVRTAFALFGTLSAGSSISGISGKIFICVGEINVLKGLNTFKVGQLTFSCGSQVTLTDNYLAYTPAGGNPATACATFANATTCKDISPKCGVSSSITINVGVDGGFINSNATCAGNDGAINLTPTGGAPFAAPAAPYTYAWSSLNATVPAAQVNNQDLTGLGAGTYTCRISDGNGCFVDRSTTITGSSLATPAATVTQQTTCSSATGTVAVTSPNANYTYTLTQSNVVVYTANSSGVFSGVAIGTYTLKVSQGTCTTIGNDVTISTQPATPTFTVCLVQPTLCANTGSVTVTASGGSNFTYQRNSLTAQTSNVFSNLASGSVTSLTVTNGAGCSRTTLCDNLVILCPSANRLSTGNQQTTTQQIIVEEQTKVVAYPNPFSDRIKFIVTSAVSGKGSLEVYNMLGQKVKSVYQGQIVAGSQNFELSLPSAQRSNLIYVLRVGDKRITGKLLHLNR